MDQRSSGRFHEVGGIAFEIPPLPDEIDLSTTGVPSFASNGKLPGVSGSSEEEFGNFDFSLPDLPTSSIPPPQSNTGPALEQEVDGVFADFPGPVNFPDTITETSTSSSSTPNVSRKVQDTGTKHPDPEEFWGFTAASDSQVPPSPPSADFWSTLPKPVPLPTSNGSVGVTALKDSSNQHAILMENIQDPVPSEDDPGPVAMGPANASSEDTGFADFTHFVASTQPIADDSFGEFTSAESDPHPTMDDKGDGNNTSHSVVHSEDFGNFSTITAVTSSSTHSAKATTAATVAVAVAADDDCFGDFRSFSGPTSVSDEASTTTESKNDDFGDFGSFSVPTSGSNMAFSTKSKGNGDFGSFAITSSTNDYGNSGSFITTPPAAELSSVQQKNSGNKMVPMNVMLACFPTAPTAPEESTNCYKQLAQCVQEGVESQQLWARLVEEAGSSGSLYKWIQSFLQDHFYSAIKVDPMLAPAMKPVAGTFSAGGLVGDDPFSPVFSSSALLAAEFGFEPASTPTAVQQMNMETDTFGWDSGTQSNGPTLLDLSRPDSPPPEANQAPLLGSDLLGLDFTTADSNNGPIQEPTTPTSWMDSELLELNVVPAQDASMHEGPGNHGTPQTSTSSVLNVEEQLLQLGLDTTKTTWWTSKDEDNHELSLAAKSVLDRLPNVDFLTAEKLLIFS